MGADERFYPGTSRITEIESFHRYYMAASLCKDCVVLDAASGEGYGSNIISSAAKKVTGLDLCKEAVDNANEKYGSKNLSYVNGSALEMPFADKSFDRVVSFETIEHLPDHRKFLSEIRRVLKDDGLLILSSPNKTPFRKRNPGENEYHITELEAGELPELFKEFFPNIRIYSQDAFYNSIISAEGAPSYYVQGNDKKIVSHPGLSLAQYSIILASAGELPQLESSCYLDASWNSTTGYTVDDEAVVNQFGLRGEFEKKYAECEALRSETAEKESALNKECAKSDYLYSRCNELDEKLLAENAKNGYLFEKCSDLESKNENLVREKAELEENIAEKESKNSYLFEKCNSLEFRNEELDKKKAELEKSIADAGAKSDYLYGKCNDLESRNSYLTEKCGDLESSCTALDDKRAELEKSVAEESAKNSYLSEKCNDLESRNETLVRNIAEESAKNSYLYEKCNTLEVRNEALDKEKAELEKSVADAGAKSDYLYGKCNDLESRNSYLTEKCGDLESRNEALDRVRVELEEKISAAAARNSYLTEKCGDLESANANLDKEKAELERIIAEKISKTEYIFSRCRELEEQNRALSEKQLELEKDIADKVAHNSQLFEMCSELEEQNRALNGKQLELEKDVAGKAAVNEELSGKCSELEKLLAGESEKSEYLHSKCNELDEKLLAELDKNNALSVKCLDLEDEISNQQTRADEYSARCAGLEAELEERRKNNQELAAKYDEICRKFETEQNKTQNLIKECAILENKLKEEQQRYQELAEKYADLERRFREECAKSEYLWCEYNEMKNSWSYKMIGRFRLRRKAGNLAQNVGKAFYSAGKKVVAPMKYSKKMALKDRIYGSFGKILGTAPGYRDWQARKSLSEHVTLQGDTGLVVPKDVPMTSIVIPVYNNIDYTRHCIYSIYKNKGVSPFEIIVVDDCSSKDDYTELLKDFPEVRLIRNEKNSGFLLTANKGGENAKGEYVLFLNNDTEVTPGWLDELTTALYHHPEAGMIGSQLIHLSTGLLQESGNLICKNGDMMPLGRGVEPNHPNYTYFREVDFCSAASIILRKKVFDEMKGFDTIYVPAYFEDPDLGLRMQKAGYKNYVCPLSKVLHKEMASYGDTLNDKCEKNRQTFLKRWSEYLQEHSLYESREEGSSSFKWNKERILFIDAETPMADRGSGGMDSIFFMEYMIKRGYHVCFHGEYTPGYDPKYTSILCRMGVECIYLPYRKIWEYLPENGWTFSHIFVCRIYQARCFDHLLKKYCPQATYIFDTVDVHFVREKLEADLRNDPELQKLAADTKKYELAAAGAADATIVISSDEKKLLENDYNLKNVYHIPQARQLFGLAPNQNRRGSVFIGSAHPPNMDGLKYFHDEILPLLPKSFELTIIGEALRNEMSKRDEYKHLLKCPQFKFVGFVADLGDVLNNAKMTVAPLRYGAGTKGKVASSMSYGIPCVSSGFGTEGTGMEHGSNIMIAHTPEEFAKYIMELEKDADLWKKISDGGIKFIRDNYAPEAVEKMMDDLFADVLKNKAEGKSNWAATPVMPKVD